jgi:hypothetical protein
VSFYQGVLKKIQKKLFFGFKKQQTEIIWPSKHAKNADKPESKIKIEKLKNEIKLLKDQNANLKRQKKFVIEVNGINLQQLIKTEK